MPFPHQFNKKSFPGLGSLSPKAKKEKAEFEKAAEVSNYIDTVLGWFERPSKVIPMGPTSIPPDTTIVDLTNGAKIKAKPDLEYNAITETYEKLKELAKKVPVIVETQLTQPEESNLKGLVLPAQKEEKPPVVTKKKSKAKNGKSKAERGKAVYGWEFTSSREVEGGVRAKYQTYLWEDGSVSCNCMGWVFPKKDPKTGEKIRKCKHTDEVQNGSSTSASAIYKKWKKGEPLPVVDTNTQMLDKNIPTEFHKTGSSIGGKRAMDTNF